MTQEELNRLNELKEKYDADEEFFEYRDLLSKVCTDDAVKPKSSLMGEYKGTKFYLELPYEKVGIDIDGKYVFKQYGFNMTYINEKGWKYDLCESLCKKDVIYFVDRMNKEIERLKNDELEGEKGNDLL